MVKKIWFLLALAVGISGCKKDGSEDRPNQETTMEQAPIAIDGVLVTYRGGTEIGREIYKMDANGLTSSIQLAGNQIKLSVPLTIGSVQGQQLGQSFERELGEDTLALENGSWQAYAIAADRFDDALLPRPVQVLLPSSNQRIEGTIQVTRSGLERHVIISLGGLEVKARVSKEGRVLSASIPAQGIEVLPQGQLPEVSIPEVPENVELEAFVLQRPDAVLKGELWVSKKKKAPTPLVVIVAGSGPTDRDGNNAAGLKTNTYRLIAEGLADQGVSTLRYDKRLVGASSSTLSESSLTIQTYSNDLVGVLRYFEGDARFSEIFVAGHSEGGLLAILAAQNVPLSGLILLAAAGRSLEEVLLEQLGARAAEFMPDVRRILAVMKEGKDVEEIPDGLQGLFRPSVQPFLRSQLTLDPSELLGELDVPVLIIQGTHDVQVKELDAQRLHKARPDARLVLLEGSSHVLKDDGPEFPQKSYNDPELALSKGLLPAMMEFLENPSKTKVAPK